MSYKSMKRLLNLLNSLIVFAALICFPIVIFITYNFDNITTKKLDEINQLFLKIDESNQKQLMFHKSEYSHYVLITSAEYTNALADIIECYEHCLNKMELTPDELEKRKANLKIFKAAQAHRLEILNNINKEYAERMMQIKKLVEKEVKDTGEKILNSTKHELPIKTSTLKSEVEILHKN